MDAVAIIQLLEKPTRNRWPFVYQIRDEAAVPDIIAALADPDERVRDAARDALDHLAYATVPPKSEQEIKQLIAQLQSVEADERQAAATALGDLVDERELAPLLALLQHKRDEVRHAATLTLASIGEGRDAEWFVRAHREQVQAPLIQVLHDPDSRVRAASAQALGPWGDQRAVEPLLAIIQDEDADSSVWDETDPL